MDWRDGSCFSGPGLPLPGITDPDTALLTQKTNTCKLFKKISIKLPGWLRAAPSAQPVRPPHHPMPRREVLGEAGICWRLLHPIPRKQDCPHQQVSEKCGAQICPAGWHCVGRVRLGLTVCRLVMKG